ncbi:MAG: branched-chain amino acid ABC transporter permease, partial [Christensenellaceae bacterium]|nr:branched-chain amino acid ABC transporter permease [Christensenellaceae bacterium]
LAAMPYLGWALGTLLGAAAGSLLPASVTTALGVAIYGMFIAIIVPPMKKLKAVRLVVLVALGLNLMLKYVPLFDFISDGVAIVLCSVVAAGVGAYCRPAEEGA